MSDLSWLNPTPHAIAVYASRPLSPVATQHSLPSGRYPLLGPDFHRLDRTSLRLAHSLDRLVGSRKQRRWNRETKRSGSRDVDDELELGRLHHRQIARFLAFENPSNIHAHETIHIRQAVAVCHQTASASEVAQIVDRRYPM